MNEFLDFLRVLSRLGIAVHIHDSNARDASVLFTEVSCHAEHLPKNTLDAARHVQLTENELLREEMVECIIVNKDDITGEFLLEFLRDV